MKIWCIPDHYPDQLRVDLPSDAVNQLANGSQILEWGSIECAVDASQSSLRQNPVLYANSRFPLLSEDTASSCGEILKDSVQLLPVKILFNDGVAEQYYVINVTSKAELLDLEKSEYIPITGTNLPLTFLSVQLKNSSLLELTSCLIARDPRYASVIFIDDNFETNLQGFPKNQIDAVDVDEFLV